MSVKTTKISDQEIIKYKKQFKDLPEALDALDLIAENNGDLEYSTVLLAGESEMIAISKSPSNVLKELSEKCRNVICKDAFIKQLMKGLVTLAVKHLAEKSHLPIQVATTIVIYLMNVGIEGYCKVN